MGRGSRIVRHWGDCVGVVLRPYLLMGGLLWFRYWSLDNWKALDTHFEMDTTLVRLWRSRGVLGNEEVDTSDTLLQGRCLGETVKPMEVAIETLESKARPSWRDGE